MTYFTRHMAALGLAVSATALAASPAAAQVNGIATVDVPSTLAASQAVQQGWQQINTQYEAQRTQIEQLQQQREQALQPLDTNGDGQLSEEEGNAAPDATVQQVQNLDQQIAQIQAPIQRARIYVVNQAAQEYSAARQQVINDRGIQILIAPEALDYGPDAINITPAVTQALDTRLPSVSITPPQDWQPTQQVAQLYQQVQQTLIRAILMQQQAQQGQQQPAQEEQQQPVPGR